MVQSNPQDESLFRKHALNELHQLEMRQSQQLRLDEGISIDDISEFNLTQQQYNKKMLGEPSDQNLSTQQTESDFRTLNYNQTMKTFTREWTANAEDDVIKETAREYVIEEDIKRGNSVVLEEENELRKSSD